MNKVKDFFTPRVFSESFYYIAPGIDFQPLLRFSNQTTVFFYANLYLGKEEILKGLKEFTDNNDLIRLTDIAVYADFDETRYFKLHPDYRTHLREASFLTSQEGDAYLDTFHAAMSDRQWLIKAEFVRPSLSRKITLLYFTGEGLASYVALSHNGTYPPKILCTIQSGQLERPNGITRRLFENTANSPYLWVRGFQPDGYVSSDLDNILQGDGPFDQIAMDFSFKWRAKDYNIDNPYYYEEKRHCKGFMKSIDMDKILKRSFKLYGNNSIFYGEIDTLIGKLDGFKLVIITRRITPSGWSNCRILYWEDLIRSTAIETSMEQSISVLQTLSNEADEDVHAITFIPFGLEDEGVLLDAFLSKTFRHKIIAVVRRPLDFIDLRTEVALSSIE